MASPFAVHLKQPQHGSSAIFQNKIKTFNKRTWGEQNSPKALTIKENLIKIKLATFVAQKIPSREEKGKSQAGRRYLQYI